MELAISSYATTLHLSSKTQTRAKNIVARAEAAELAARKKAEAIIAAALYIAGILENEPHTLAEVGEATGVSPTTIQKHKTRIVRILGIRKT